MTLLLAFASSLFFAAAYVLQYHEAHEAPRRLFLSPACSSSWPTTASGSAASSRCSSATACRRRRSGWAASPSSSRC